MALHSLWRQIAYRQNRGSVWAILFLTLLATTGCGASDPSADVKDSSPPNETAKPAISTPPTVAIGVKTGALWAGNNAKIEFLWCEPGTFIMGSPKDEPERGDDEDEVSVTLTKGFWLGKYEVTQEQWQSVMGSTPWEGKTRVRVAPDSPACYVSWDDANLFCRELTRKERESGTLPDGWEYALPTEAQWEYACRAGTITKYSFGNDDARLFDYAWYGEQQRQPPEMNARAVGRKKPNPWGFYDLHGNVVEWCRDWYRPKYPGGEDPFVATDQDHFVMARGGEFRRERNWARSATRQHLLTAGQSATVGMRVSLQQRASRSEVTAVPTVRIAVVSFEHRGTVASHERLGQALAGMVASDLSRLAALDVLERQTSQDLFKESTLAATGITEKSSAGKDTKFADYVLTGTCSVADGTVTVTATLSRSGIAKPHGEWTVHGLLDDVFRMEGQLSRNVIESLEVPTDLRKDPLPVSGGSPRLAILPFTNNSSSARLDDMQMGFAEILQASLGEIKGVRLVDRQQLEKILTEQKLTMSGLIDPRTAVQIGKLAGARRLLTGSFLEIGRQLSVQVRLIDTTTGAVVGAAQVTGASGQFSALLDDLAQRITAKLEIAPLESADQTDPPSPSGRTLESAMHAGAGARLEKEGNLPKAAEAYQRSILIEPQNLNNHLRLVHILNRLERYEESIPVGEHALLYPKILEINYVKEPLLAALSYAYARTGRVDPARQLLDRYGGVSDKLRFDLTDGVADALIKKSRFPEAVNLMETMAENDVARNGILRSDGLKRLFTFHWHHSTSIAGIPIETHQIEAQKAIDIYLRVLDAAKGARNDDAAKWARHVIPFARDLQTISAANQRVAFLSPIQQAEYRQREKDAFGWMERSEAIPVEREFENGIASEKEKSWQEAVDSFRRFLDRSPNSSADEVWPETIRYRDWIDKRIEAHSRMARLLATRLNRPDEARESYRALVRDVGLSHFAGPDVLFNMHALKLTPEIPARAALVWGGSTSNLIGWKKLLAAQNLTVHSLRKASPTLADLAAYRIVILCRSHNDVFSPDDVMTLRTYLAAGGSLLVVVSPMCHASAPILHNSLLATLTMEVGKTLGEQATSTQIRPHAITGGIESFTAFHPVGLRAAEQSALVNVRDETLVAALEPGRGRVVVAGIGQWYTPETLLIPEMDQPPRKTVSVSNYLGGFARIRGSKPEPPLLRQVIQWLNEPRNEDPSFTQWHSEWQSALVAFSEAQACLIPLKFRLREWDELPAIFDRLIAASPDSDLRDAALWTAGECLLKNAYMLGGAMSDKVHNRHPHMEYENGRRWFGEVLSCNPKYFQELVDRHRGGLESGYAQLRLANAHRIKDPEPIRHVPLPGGRDLAKLAELYKPLDLTKGTYPYAWCRLEMGALSFAAGNVAQALSIFDEVAESMPISAEKSIALLDSARCQILLGDFKEARRRLEQADLLPVCRFDDSFRRFYALLPRNPDFLADFSYFGESRQMGIVLRQDIEKFEKDERARKWLDTRSDSNKVRTPVP